MTVRHCLMAGMCGAATKVNSSHYPWDCGWSTSGSQHASGTSNPCYLEIKPAVYACDPNTSKHCERKWIEAVN